MRLHTPLSCTRGSRLPLLTAASWFCRGAERGSAAHPARRCPRAGKRWKEAPWPRARPACKRSPHPPIVATLASLRSPGAPGQTPWGPTGFGGGSALKEVFFWKDARVCEGIYFANIAEHNRHSEGSYSPIRSLERRARVKGEEVPRLRFLTPTTSRDRFLLTIK